MVKLYKSPLLTPNPTGLNPPTVQHYFQQFVFKFKKLCNFCIILCYRFFKLYTKHDFIFHLCLNSGLSLPFRLKKCQKSSTVSPLYRDTVGDRIDSIVCGIRCWVMFVIASTVLELRSI